MKYLIGTLLAIVSALLIAPTIQTAGLWLMLAAPICGYAIKEVRNDA
jgi:hypothetical protein